MTRIAMILALGLGVGLGINAGLALAQTPTKPHDYRDGVITALQVQRNQALDAVASLNATLAERQGEVDSLTEQLKVLAEKQKVCNAADPKDH